MSFYLRLGAAVSTHARIALITAGGVTVGNLQLRTTGALRLRNDATQVGADSAPLTVGKIYRIGLRQKRGTGNNAILEAYLAQGDAPFGAPFAASSTQTFTARATRVSFGATNSIAIDGTFDDISIDTAAMPQPTPPQVVTPATAPMKRPLRKSRPSHKGRQVCYYSPDVHAKRTQLCDMGVCLCLNVSSGWR